MMDEASPILPRRARRGPAWAALFGAALAGVLLLAAAWGAFDFWLVAAAVIGIAFGVLLVAGRAGPRAASAPAARRLAVSEALLANIPDPVVLIDRQGTVVEANEAARALFPALAVHRPLSLALRNPDVLDGIAQALRSGERLKVEYAERIPAERAYEVLIGPLAGADAGSGVVLFFRDLTTARQLERMRVDFVANASHELRTPLASLLGFVETLQGPARDDPAARERFLAIMHGQAERMTRLIEDLLSLSRIEMRAHLRPETPVDLRPLVAQVVEGIAPLARERGVEIRLDAPSDPLMVLGDRDELLRAVENLIENGVKYGESGGRVDVTVERLPAADGLGPRIAVAVRDDGPGIAPEHLPRLTERFYRVDVAESRQKGGTGLGLAIVKHIVARHRGRLAIESEPGKGALFRITLSAVARPSDERGGVSVSASTALEARPSHAMLNAPPPWRTR